MRKIEFVLILVLVIIVQLYSVASAAAGAPDTPEDFKAAFKELKTLVGEWEGQGQRGRVRVTYQLTGRGSALVETFYSESYDDASESSMSSVYHMDGDELMVTHYCGAGNQPRMKATSYRSDRGLVQFDFTDITNLSAPSAYYTREVELQIQDKDHLQVRFNGLLEGEERPAAFELTRLAED